MALHIMPEPEDGHRHDEQCPCSPTRTEGEAEHPRDRGQVYRGVIYTHRPFDEAPTPAPAVELHDRIAIPVDDLDDEWTRVAATLPAGYRLAPAAVPEVGAEATCGHIVVETDAGEWQHHDIPDSADPHAPTSECGCGPQRDETSGHVVYVHVDQADNDEDGGGDQ